MDLLEKPALFHKEAQLDAVREFYAAGEYDISSEELGMMQVFMGGRSRH